MVDMTYNMRFQNAELVDACAWKDGEGTWYMKLMYRYQDGNNTRYVCFPKVEFPFETFSLPTIHEYGLVAWDKKYHIELTKYLVDVREGDVKIPGTGYIVRNVCFVDGDFGSSNDVSGENRAGR